MKNTVIIKDPQRPDEKIQGQVISTYNLRNDREASKKIKANMLARVKARQKAKEAKE